MGITGPIRFDPHYKTREDFFMDIVEYNNKMFKKVAEWNAIDRLMVTRSLAELQYVKAANIQSKKFRVVTRLGLPYLIDLNQTDLYNNDRYAGFVRDFMDEIAKLNNFTYELYIVPGNHHGQHNHITGKWDGIVGEILNGVSII